MPKRESQVLAFALSLPESWEDHPWGETVAKVGAKVFVFLGGERITVKLDESHAHASSRSRAASPPGTASARQAG